MPCEGKLEIYKIKGNFSMEGSNVNDSRREKKPFENEGGQSSEEKHVM